MNKVELITQLIHAPARIRQVEEEVARQQFRLADAKSALEREKCSILLGREEGRVVDGKNAEVREAQLKGYLEAAQSIVEERQDLLSQAVIELHYEQNQFAAARAMARLLAGSEEG